MNYEKLYKEALERAKIWKHKNGMPKDKQGVLDDIFPELKESEDERIRKEIIEFLRHCVNEHHIVVKAKWFAWLEKQCEQKSTNKNEPKFHEGEWITNGDYIWKIVKVKPLDYILQSQDGNIVDDTIFFVDKHFHLWSIEDAKPGDILGTKEDKRPFIFKGLLDKVHPNAPVAYCGIDSENLFLISTGIHWWNDEEIEPATKEQCNLLFSKMKEAGYKWDADKKELKPIFDIEIPYGAKDSELQEVSYYIPEGFHAEIEGNKVIIKQGEQKPTETAKWSPQEESCTCQLESLIKERWRQAEKLHDDVNIKKMSELMFFLKTLDPNKKPQRIISAEAKEALYNKSSWSEDDENIKEDIILNLQENYRNKYINERTCLDEIHWLKSLKERIKGEQ